MVDASPEEFRQSLASLQLDIDVEAAVLYDYIVNCPKKDLPSLSDKAGARHSGSSFNGGCRRSWC